MKGKTNGQQRIPGPGEPGHFLPRSGTKGFPQQRLVFDRLVSDEDARNSAGTRKIRSLYFKIVWVHFVLLPHVAPKCTRFGVTIQKCTVSSLFPPKK